MIWIAAMKWDVVVGCRFRGRAAFEVEKFWVPHPCGFQGCGFLEMGNRPRQATGLISFDG
jgi:hypothetical protein